MKELDSTLILPNMASPSTREGLIDYALRQNGAPVLEINIEDDGVGFPKDVLSRIGYPYLKSIKKEITSKSGLGLGIFIGKTLLEKNYAKIILRNSETRYGAEVNIKWRNNDLMKI